MQLTIEVLPAPFGPMMENNSPSLTPKETSVSARTPPKRSDTPRTSKACSTQSLRQRVIRVRFIPAFAHPLLDYRQADQWGTSPLPCGGEVKACAARQPYTSS